MKITIKKSFRKTISLRIKNQELIINAPFLTTKKFIDNFIKKHGNWIKNKLKQEKENHIWEEKIKELKTKAKNYIPKRVEKLAKDFSINFNKIKISSAKTRWWSCSAKKNLNFSFRLMLHEEKTIDYVIIHELAHLKHMNHSKDFWKEVEKMMPDYKKYEKKLKSIWD